MSKVCASSPISPSPVEKLNSSEKPAPGLSKSPSLTSRHGSQTHVVFADRLLSDRDVAARYQVEKQTIWRWARTSCTFPKPFKIEGTARWSEHELDEHDRKLKEARQ